MTLTQVFACSVCRREHVQQLGHDLFDGVQSDGSFESFGLEAPEPAELACLSVHERLALSVLKMADATFKAYAGYGYMHYSGGGTLGLNDYTGAAALLVRNPEDDQSHAMWGGHTVDEGKLRAALTTLLDGANGSPIVQQMLTCLERELDRPQPLEDAFPARVGRGGMPMLSEGDASGQAGDNGPAGSSGRAGGEPVAGLTLNSASRLLQQCAFTGVYQTVEELDPSATTCANQLGNQVLGTMRTRLDNATRHQPAVGSGRGNAVDGALHTTLYYKGGGAHYEHEGACPAEHYRKLRLGGANPKFRHAEEFLWSQYQQAIKKQFHARGPRLVNAEVAAAATPATVQAQHAQVAAALSHHMTTAESFSGGVSKDVVGGKRYWHTAFIELMAMAVEYGIPQFFGTFTANESGWGDVTQACDGVNYVRRPVEATRQYHHRWSSFKARFLTGDTPLGKVLHTWHRQARLRPLAVGRTTPTLALQAQPALPRYRHPCARHTLCYLAPPHVGRRTRRVRRCTCTWPSGSRGQATRTQSAAPRHAAATLRTQRQG